MQSESLEARILLAADFGDAPDLGAGTGSSDYETLAANNGPSHTIDTTQFTLFLGGSVDGDDGLLQNAGANADDVDAAIPDDEDGVLSPLDLQGTIGTSPTITLLATNTTGAAATLSGWIDYNQDGVFDNASERAQIAVPDGTVGGRVTLTFPTITGGAIGQTYSRFRLSTDGAASNPTGPAADGEVEDHTFTINSQSTGVADESLKIASDTNGVPPLANGDSFGSSMASLGDLDGDGIGDIAVGASGDDTYGSNRGAVYIALLNADGSVKSGTKIASSIGGGPVLSDSGFFGRSLATIGDLDGDGVTDLAVGAYLDSTGGSSRGAVYVLFLNANGTVKGSTKIADSLNGGPTLVDSDRFGVSVAGLGDLDGDGVVDLAVGAYRDDTGGPNRGAVHVLMLNNDGTVKSSTKIAHATNGGPTLVDSDLFGASLASVGDLNADGVTDLVVGASLDDTGGTDRGAVHVLFLNSDGSVSSSTRIASGTNGGPTLTNSDQFGFSVAAIGDLDANGVQDLAVGARLDDTGGSDRGALYVVRLKPDGTSSGSTKIADGLNGGPSLNDLDWFGWSVTSVGDLDGDGVNEVAVGAPQDDTGGSERGAVWGLSLASGLDFGDAPDAGIGTGTGDYETVFSSFGASHSIISSQSSLFLGNSVDGDAGSLQNVRANADDAADALPDDEDGVLNPFDLQGTVGTAPAITLLVTNTTGTAATLSGWIDYNHDGVFDNATERAQIAIPDGTTDVRATLTFPTIPGASAGKTYARFRLGTGAASENATGYAGDGEVEDYVFVITAASPGTVGSTLKIAHETNGGPTLSDGDQFGESVAALGDLNGDGIEDVAVGAPNDNGGGFEQGAVYIAFLNSDGTAKGGSKITSGTGGGPTLQNYDSFGNAIASIGDLDGDGVDDLAVGAFGDNTGGDRRGAVHILFMQTDGTAKSSTKIAHETNGGPTLEDYNEFGSSLAPLGDLDGDGVNDLAVGANGDSSVGYYRGAVHVLLMNPDGTVKSSTRIASGTNGGPALSDDDYFGISMAALGDIDGDGVGDLAVGAEEGSAEGQSRGAVHILFLQSNGTAKSTTRIASEINGGPTLADDDLFGSSLTGIGDLDGDGVNDLAVGAEGDDTGGLYAGAVHLLLLKPDGTVKNVTKIAHETNGGPTLGAFNFFGSSLAAVGDLDGNGTIELAVGTPGDGTGGNFRGAVWGLWLDPFALSITIDQDSMSENGGTSTATVTRGGTDTSSELVVSLTSNDLTEATVPSSVTIPANETSVSFTISAVDDPVVDGTQTVTITASASGLGSTTDTIDVTDEEATTPAVTGPTGITNDMTPEITWTAVPGAARYELYVRNLTTKVRVVDRDDLTTNSFTPASPLDGTTYRVWVRAFSASGEAGEWTTEDYRFRVGNAPQITSPTIYRITDSTPTVVWNTIPDNQWGDPLSFELWIKRHQTKYDHILNITELNYTTESLPMGRYNFWVRAILPGGLEAGWSRAREVVIVTPPTLTGPTGSVGTLTPTITWNALPGAATYELYISDETDGVSPLLQPNGITETSWVVTPALTSGHAYKVWIRAYDEKGWRGYYGSAMDFNVANSDRPEDQPDTLKDPTPEGLETDILIAALPAIDHENLTVPSEPPATPTDDMGRVPDEHVRASKRQQSAHERQDAPARSLPADLAGSQLPVDTGAEAVTLFDRQMAKLDQVLAEWATSDRGMLLADR